MTPITHTHYNSTVAEELAKCAEAETGFMGVRCEWTKIPETGLVAYALRFPAGTQALSVNVGTWTVVEYNRGQDDISVTINSQAYGNGIKYEGLPDYDGYSIILFVRQYTPDQRDEEELDEEQLAEISMEIYRDVRMSGGSLEAAMEEYNYARMRRR